MARRLLEEEAGEKGSPTANLCPRMQMSLCEPSSDNASLVLPSTDPSVAILLTRCLLHSFSRAEYLMLTAVNFKQPFSVCFPNFVYSDRFSILGWGEVEAKYLMVPSFRDKTEKRSGSELTSSVWGVQE